MKKLLLLLPALLLFISANAQLDLNPQAGINIVNLSKPPSGESFSGTVGLLAGTDLRIGGKYYFQPGLFLNRSTTISKYTNIDSITYSNSLYRTTIKLKTMVGVKLVNKSLFKIRLCAGPSYDFLLAINNKYNDQPTNTYSKSNFQSGTFNVDGGLGFDLWFVSLDLGYSYGLTNAFKAQGNNKYNSTFAGIYITAGIILGDSVKESKKSSSSKKNND